MPVTFDPAKSEHNQALRGLAFGLADSVEWDTALILEDAREDYAERRYQALGFDCGAPAHVGIHAARRCRACDQPAPGERARKEPICHASKTLN